MSEPAVLRSGYVGIVGWTNVGKSTLLNRLVGTRLAAVADVAQTTRHRIEGARTVEGRGQIIFVDTPGLHRPKYRMNRAMVERVRETLGGVDRVLLVVDAARGLGPGDREAIELVSRAGVPATLVLNKMDRLRNKNELLPMIEAASRDFGFADIVPVSALTGEGCDHLLEHVFDCLPECAPLFPDDYLTDQPERVLAAEWVREQLLAATREELPHSLAVTVESWTEREDGLLEIRVNILVDRESQKKIVIGKAGDVLKTVGSVARARLEAFLERRVFLGLWVKVRRDWRDDEQTLRQLGLE